MNLRVFGAFAKVVHLTWKVRKQYSYNEIRAPINDVSIITRMKIIRGTRLVSVYRLRAKNKLLGTKTNCKEQQTHMIHYSQFRGNKYRVAPKKGTIDTVDSGLCSDHQLVSTSL